MAHPLQSREAEFSRTTYHRLIEKTAFGRSFCDDIGNLQGALGFLGLAKGIRPS